jgi:hypothetical protein
LAAAAVTPTIPPASTPTDITTTLTATRKLRTLDMLLLHLLDSDNVDTPVIDTDWEIRFDRRPLLVYHL